MYEKDTRVRRSPSGPVLALGFGAGAMLRLAEDSTTIVGSLAVPQNNTIQIGRTLGDNFKMVMTHPSPDLDYRGTVFIDVVNTADESNSDVSLFIDTSKDGSTWQNRVANLHIIGGADYRYIRLDMVLTSGEDLGVIEGDAALYLRARIGSTTNTVEVDSNDTTQAAQSQVGTAYLSMSEHLPTDFA